MSRATSVLADLIAAGASIKAENGELVIDDNLGKVTLDMLRASAENKAEVLSLVEEGRGVPWEDWQAASLNRMFQEQGVTGERGRITAATVRHGERQTGSMEKAGVRNGMIEAEQPAQFEQADAVTDSPDASRRWPEPPEVGNA